jgi:3-methyladenine DNA glycosylase AlkD
LGYKSKTDLALLAQVILALNSSKEFFIQKAIGWSMREVSKWKPIWVQKVVLEENLQGLAKREALKYVPEA